MTGLFQDTGSLILNQLSPDYLKYYKLSFYRPFSVLEHEKKLFGVNHAVISYLFAKHWQLPEAVCFAIYNSHIDNLSEMSHSEVRALVSALRIANHTIGENLFPKSIFESEATPSVGSAYLEAMVEISILSESIVDIRESLDLH